MRYSYLCLSKQTKMRYIIFFISLFCVSTITAQTKLSADDFLDKVDNNNITLLDVRTAEEFKNGTILHAKNIDWNQPDVFKTEISKLDKKQPIYLFCFSGGRSESAAKLLSDQGYQVYELDGGMLKMRADSNLDDSTNNKAISSNEFDKLKSSNGLTLIDYTAKWCAPCRKMKPYLEKINENKSYGVEVVFIDADQNASLLKELQIKALPRLELYKKGELVWKHSALIEEQALLDILKSHK